MRTLLILLALLSVAAGGFAVSQLGVEGLGAYISGFSGPSADVAKRDPMIGSCDATTGVGPNEPLCTECLRRKRGDCYPPGPIPRLDCGATASDEEVLRTVRDIVTKLRELQRKSKADLKTDDDFMDKNIDPDGRCSAELQGYLERRVKDFERPGLQSALEGLDDNAACVRDRHSKASKRKEEEFDPKLRTWLDMKSKNLDAAANDLEKAMRGLTAQTEINQALTRYHRYIKYCSQNRQNR